MRVIYQLIEYFQKRKLLSKDEIEYLKSNGLLEGNNNTASVDSQNLETKIDIQDIPNETTISELEEECKYDLKFKRIKQKGSKKIKESKSLKEILYFLNNNFEKYKEIFNEIILFADYLKLTGRFHEKLNKLNELEYTSFKNNLIILLKDRNINIDKIIEFILLDFYEIENYSKSNINKLLDAIKVILKSERILYYNKYRNYLRFIVVRKLQEIILLQKRFRKVFRDLYENEIEVLLTIPSFNFSFIYSYLIFLILKKYKNSFEYIESCFEELTNNILIHHENMFSYNYENIETTISIDEIIKSIINIETFYELPDLDLSFLMHNQKDHYGFVKDFYIIFSEDKKPDMIILLLNDLTYFCKISLCLLSIKNNTKRFFKKILSTSPDLKLIFMINKYSAMKNIDIEVKIINVIEIINPQNISNYILKVRMNGLILKYIITSFNKMYYLIVCDDLSEYDTIRIYDFSDKKTKYQIKEHIYEFKINKSEYSIYSLMLSNDGSHIIYYNNTKDKFLMVNCKSFQKTQIFFNNSFSIERTKYLKNYIVDINNTFLLITFENNFIKFTDIKNLKSFSFCLKRDLVSNIFLDENQQNLFFINDDFSKNKIQIKYFYVPLRYLKNLFDIKSQETNDYVEIDNIKFYLTELIKYFTFSLREIKQIELLNKKSKYYKTLKELSILDIILESENKISTLDLKELLNIHYKLLLINSNYIF